MMCRAFEHHAFALAEYIIGHLNFLPMTSQNAARLLELDAQVSSTSRTLSGHTISGAQIYGVSEVLVNAYKDDSQRRDQLIGMLRSRSLAVIQNIPFHSDIFLPLTRNGLILALQSCYFDAPEMEVITAVENWVLHSPWVDSTYGGAGMQDEQVRALSFFVDPTCLSAEEFATVDRLFFLDTQVCSLSHHCPIIVPSLSHHCPIIVPSLSHHCPIMVPSLCCNINSLQ
jgi:hypothetical protein